MLFSHQEFTSFQGEGEKGPLNDTKAISNKKIIAVTKVISLNVIIIKLNKKEFIK